MRIMVRDYAGRVSGPYDFDTAVRHAVRATGGEGVIEQQRERIGNLCALVARLLKHSNLKAPELEQVLGPQFDVTEER